jgi:hypothetical protein
MADKPLAQLGEKNTAQGIGLRSARKPAPESAPPAPGIAAGFHAQVAHRCHSPRCVIPERLSQSGISNEPISSAPASSKKANAPSSVRLRPSRRDCSAPTRSMAPVAAQCRAREDTRSSRKVDRVLVLCLIAAPKTRRCTIGFVAKCRNSRPARTWRGHGEDMARTRRGHGLGRRLRGDRVTAPPSPVLWRPFQQP